MESDYSASRLPPSSSALVALSTLTPPSPLLTPSLLSTSITSGDIPILLDGLAFSANHRYSTASNFSNRRLSGINFYESDLPQSCSCASTGTFGPIYRRPPLVYREPQKHHVRETISTHEDATSAWSQTRLGTQESPEQAFETSYSDYSSLSYVATQPTLEVRMPRATVKSDYGGNISESPATDSKPPVQKERLSLRVGLGAQLAAFPAQHNDMYDAFTNASNRPSSMTSSKFKFKPVTYSVSSGEKRKSTLNLDSIRAVVSIDQEGFRSVNPSFKFVGYRRRTCDDKRQRAENMAHFVPVNQQAFHFHYAPFDGLPVLRSISVNGDETRDYISREATLGLKSNGVYVIHGIELATQNMQDENRGHEATELHWEFLYKVDDRKVGPSKKIIDGEKNLIPLSLSCSPALLYPSQGKRINLLHIVKKSVAMKLTAERLEAAEYPFPITPGPPLHDATNSSKHRKALSHGRQSGLSTAGTKPLIQCAVLRENRADHVDSVCNTRRRRASSAGEWTRLDSQPRTTVEASVSKMYPPVQKHIVSPARLARMLETSTAKQDASPAIPQLDFHPLAPNPRHYRSRVRSRAHMNDKEK